MRTLILFALLIPISFAQPSGRSVAFGTRGMVATSHPIAAQIGVDVLKSGGNAIDAAIATSAAMALLEPTSCGIGGDLYALVWDAKTQKLYGLNASGRAPKNATLAYFKEKKLEQIPERGPLSWSVPGCVDGWDELRKKFATKSFRDLLAPSIRYAEDGAPVPPVIAGYWKASEKLLKANTGLAETFLLEGHAPKAGEVFKNPHLAKSYRAIAANGRDAYYRGDIAKAIVDYSQSVGGLFSKDDFDTHKSEWVEPVSTNYRGYDVWEIPPPGQGIATLQMLNLLEPHDLSKFGPHSADYWHLFIEMKKLAFADRAKYYADPAFAKVPVSELTSKPYAKTRSGLFDAVKAMTSVDAGALGKSETIYLCTADAAGNCVSLIQSNYMGFGSGHAVPGLGFGLQNRGCLFALDEHHANRLEPGKRPFHTIIPGFVSKDGKPWLVFGVMGGDMQPQGQVQVLMNLIDFHLNVQQAGETARMEHVGSATPTGLPMKPHGGTVQVEPGIPDAVVQDLTRRGHVIQRVKVNGGGYQGILIQNGVFHGGSEPRKDGLALGY